MTYARNPVMLIAANTNREEKEMARARKSRKVCSYPHICEFAPVSVRKRGVVVMSVDEYETIRLIDKECLSQEQCGKQMKVSRTTVQLIYSSARRKLAAALVNGLVLRIEGGDYELCGGGTGGHVCRGCFRHGPDRQHAD